MTVYIVSITTQNNACICICGILVWSLIPLMYRNGGGSTPLHWAAAKGHAEIASLLVKADAPLEAKDRLDVSA